MNKVKGIVLVLALSLVGCASTGVTMDRIIESNYVTTEKLERKIQRLDSLLVIIEQRTAKRPVMGKKLNGKD